MSNLRKPNGITILGLGPGDPGLVTRQAWELIQNSTEIYLRTNQHPVVSSLPDNLTVHSFDAIYQQEDDFKEVYRKIVKKVLKLGKRKIGVVYAVPGHPFVAESTSVQIIHKAKEANIPVQIIEGLSFVEPVLTLLGVDPISNFTLVDALEITALHHPSFPPTSPALISQMYSKAVAAQVKIALMAVYPDEHPVQLVHVAGTQDALVEKIPLHLIDRSEHIGLLTSLYVPPLEGETSFEAFQELIAHLRAPEGCPWDREQTHQTLRPNLLEEAYEALSAMDADDPKGMQEELGDLLLQIVLHSQIASEYGEFRMTDVIQGIHSKLVRRHPHVFGDLKLPDADSVIHNWERLKADERQSKGDGESSLLDGIPQILPALAQSDGYQKRAARVGFDWPDIQGVLDKIVEEVEEVRQAPDGKRREEEMGDLFFALVNLARWYEVDAESALRGTNQRFRYRFGQIEAGAKRQNKQVSDLTLDEMDEIWNGAKSGDS